MFKETENLNLVLPINTGIDQELAEWDDIHLQYKIDQTSLTFLKKYLKLSKTNKYTKKES